MKEQTQLNGERIVFTTNGAGPNGQKFCNSKIKIENKFNIFVQL